MGPVSIRLWHWLYAINITETKQQESLKMNQFRPFDKDNDDPIRAIAQRIIDQAKPSKSPPKPEEAKKEEEK
jgi:hypothetical protein